MKLILLGAPGAGKGTLASALIKRLGIPSVSTGNILREEIKNGTELGNQAKSFIDAGALVPDEVVIGMLEKRIKEEDCANGYILDGFPRTIPQAEALDKIADIDVALSVEVPDEMIESRMSGRRVCLKCGETFHIENNPPKIEGKCNVCPEEDLVIRKDDEISVVKSRLETYHRDTAPLKKYYASKGKLSIMDGTLGIADTLAIAVQILGV